MSLGIHSTDPISPSKSSISTTSSSSSPELLQLQQTMVRVSEIVTPSNPNPNKRPKQLFESESFTNTPGSDASPLTTISNSSAFKSPLSLPLPVCPASPPTSSMRGYSALPTPESSPWGAGLSPSPKFITSSTLDKRKRPLMSGTSPYETQHDNLKSGLLKYQNQVFRVSYFAKGSFSNVYTFNQKTPMIVPLVDDNSTLIIKAFHGEIKTGFEKGALNEFLQHSLDNYRAVQDLGLPVATIYNINTAMADRVIIQDRIPHTVNIFDPSQMAQVQKFFTAAVENKVSMDLQPANLRVDGKGTVVLIDFVEDEDLTLEPAINLACLAWCKLFKERGLTKDQARAHLEQLTAGFLNKHADFTSAWLEEILNR